MRDAKLRSIVWLMCDFRLVDQHNSLEFDL